MAYVSCAAEVAANIAQNCAQPQVGGYTGEGIYIPKAFVGTVTRDASNPRIVTDIQLTTGKSVVAIDNVMENPFDGSSTTSNTESGWGTFDKSVAVRIPLRGGKVAQDIIEPLLRSAQGGVLILPKRDQRGDGSFEVIGLEKGVKASEITRNEGENNGDWSATLQTQEYYAETVLFDTDYQTTRAKYDALLAKSY